MLLRFNNIAVFFYFLEIWLFLVNKYCMLCSDPKTAILLNLLHRPSSGLYMNDALYFVTMYMFRGADYP